MAVRHQVQNAQLDNIHGKEGDLAPAVAGLDHNHVLVLRVYVELVMGTGLG